ncbi:hypothetical protein NA78x_004793 [Anatilimnocola sp. NA78]|uniref:hypothetical protein n=1 Tax=Anatilimnocola sp. NA78 TaxID=3415683 RepID=UPI003CE52BF0
MNLPMWKKLVVVTLLMGAVGVVSQPMSLLAQKADAKAPAAETKKQVKRLPAHYKDIVTVEQRDKIYELQGKYDAQISVLAEQVKAVQKQRDSEIEALLSAEQKAKLEKARADAKTKAQEKAAAKKAATDKAAATAAVSTPAVASPAVKAAATTTTTTAKPTK